MFCQHDRAITVTPSWLNGGVVLDDLAGAVDAACDADVASLSDCESVLVLVRLQKRLASVVAKAAAACADAGGCGGGGVGGRGRPFGGRLVGRAGRPAPPRRRSGHPPGPSGA